jgi:fructuronate reductase
MRRLMKEEVAPTLELPTSVDVVAYQNALVERFGNPALPHRTQQIAMDGSQKLPQRLLGTVRDRLRADQSIDRLALAVAAWIHYLRGTDETGASHEIQDPLATALAARLAQANTAGAVHDRIAFFTGFAPVFGELGGEPRFVSAVAHHVRLLEERGVIAALQKAAA